MSVRQPQLDQLVQDLGYAGTPDQAPEAVRPRDEGPRLFKSLAEIVFAGRSRSAAGPG